MGIDVCGMKITFYHIIFGLILFCSAGVLFKKVEWSRVFLNGVNRIKEDPGSDVTTQFVPMEYYPNCSVKLVQDAQDLSRYLSQNNPTRRNCSFGDLQEYFLTTGQFYNKGIWFAPPNGKISDKIEFYPKSCTFPNTTSTAPGLQACVRKKMKKILITGDSNGRFTRKCLVSYVDKVLHIRGRKTGCVLSRSGKNPALYFRVPQVPNEYMETHLSEYVVRYAKNLQYDCSFNESKTSNKLQLTIEYIIVHHIIDSILQIRPRTVFERNPISAENEMEYLLKYYFPHRGFPDLWIYILPAQHEIWKSSLEMFELDMKYILRLIQLYLPKTTDLVFLPAIPECPKMRRKKNDPDFRSHWNVSMSDRLQEMNQLLYRLIKPMVHKEQNFHSFLDFSRLVCPVVCDWHRDIAHMHEEWYVKFSKYIVELFCQTS